MGWDNHVPVLWDGMPFNIWLRCDRSDLVFYLVGGIGRIEWMTF